MKSIFSFKKLCIYAFSVLQLLIYCSPIFAQQSEMQYANYGVNNGAITKTNGRYMFNRPLYMDHLSGCVLAGELPMLRMLHEPYNCGIQMIAFERDGKALWLQQFSNITMNFRANYVTWNISDKQWPGLALTLEVVPLSGKAGYAVKLSAEQNKASDKLIWIYGAATRAAGNAAINRVQNWMWISDPIVNPNETKRGFVYSDCGGDSISITENSFSLYPRPGIPRQTKRNFLINGRCNALTSYKLTDAAKWQNVQELYNSNANIYNMLCGETKLNGNLPVYWVFATHNTDSLKTVPVDEPINEFNAGLKRSLSIGQQIVVKTPDPYFDAGVSASCAAIDAPFYPPTYVHGAMAWNTPYLGWRSLYGATAYGWHANVKENAKFYLSYQITESKKTEVIPDDNVLMTRQSSNSRYYGKGYIDKHSGYNMQVQFFDGLIHAWRYTGDPELEKMLLPALELDLERSQECFDPDKNGVYESYINTWPTDNTGYNGGETTQETAYSYIGHKALAEMYQRVGNTEKAKQNLAWCDTIRKNMMKSLWIPEKGYFAEYREALKYKRRHDDAWLYSEFLPIEAGMLTPEEAASVLYYTEWGLERVPSFLGGERCWLSNWVPHIWSVRELYPGDNYALAMAYFFTGLANDGWNVFKGTYREMMYNKAVPGTTDVLGATDFTDVSNMFARATVDGLFGYRPNYPSNKVSIAPQFPSDWNNAEIKTVDFAYQFKKDEKSVQLNLTLQKAASVSFAIPVNASKITNVTVNGNKIVWKSKLGFGNTIVKVETETCKQADIVITFGKKLPALESIKLRKNTGDNIEIKPAYGKIVSYTDPTKGLQQPKIVNGALLAKVSENDGNHLIIATVQIGNLKLYQLLKLESSNIAQKEILASKTRVQIPERPIWEYISLEKVMNADVRKVYEQKYTSPRVKTVSVQIGTDGYTFWAMPYWNMQPPKINLNNVSDYVYASEKPDGRLDSLIMTPQEIPFKWNSYNQNIAFTSQYDNYPDSVVVPINKLGRSMWMLVAGTTNFMQTRIANAIIRINYANGLKDSIEIVPPINFWSLNGMYRGNNSPNDYYSIKHRWPLREGMPEIVQLGKDCRAVLLGYNILPGQTIESITLEALSQEVVIGLMGVTVIQ